MFRRMPIVLLLVISGIVLLDPVLPLQVKQFSYSLALSIKEIIIFLLPFIILCLLFKATVMLSKNASRVIGIIFALVLLSNFTSTFLSHFVGGWVYHFNLSLLMPETMRSLDPLWQLKLPKLLSNEKAMIVGIVLGLLLAKWRPQQALRWAELADKRISQLLMSIVVIIPFFVTGFVIKLQYDGVIKLIFHDYIAIFAVILLAQCAYLMLAYFLLSRGNVSRFLIRLKNMLPAAISGFCTMSSAASMPLTLIAAEKNTHNKDLAKSVIPATVNVHLVGDCFAIPILSYAVLKSFGMMEPTLVQYLLFTLYFVLAKFSVAAVPGGGILVMLPILESYLGFNAQMLSLITALYILFDPIITSVNVLGNGAFVQLVDYCESVIRPTKLETDKLIC